MRDLVPYQGEEEPEGEMSYPSVVVERLTAEPHTPVEAQLDSVLIHIVHTFQRREIAYSCVTLGWLMAENSSVGSLARI